MKKLIMYMVVLGISSPFFLALAYTADGGCSMYGFGGSLAGGGFLGGILTLILWVLIIIGLFYLIKFFAQGAWKSGKKEVDAIEILKRRYAKGEIKKEEFEEKKKEIGD